MYPHRPTIRCCAFTSNGRSHSSYCLAFHRYDQHADSVIQTTQEAGREQDEWDVVAKESVVVREEPDYGIKTIHLDLIVSQFCHVYPGEFKNGDIPFFLFWMMWAHCFRIIALNKVIAAEAHLIGTNITNGSDKSVQQLRRMSDYAHGHRDTL